MVWVLELLGQTEILWDLGGVVYGIIYNQLCYLSFDVVPHPQPPASLHKFHRLVDTSTSPPKPPAIMATPAFRKSRMPPHLTLLDFSGKFSQWQHFFTITDFISVLIPDGNQLSVPHIPLNLLSEVTSGPSVAKSNPSASTPLTSSFLFYFFVCMSLPFLFVSF